MWRNKTSIRKRVQPHRAWSNQKNFSVCVKKRDIYFTHIATNPPFSWWRHLATKSAESHTWRPQRCIVFHETEVSLLIHRNFQRSASQINLKLTFVNIFRFREDLFAIVRVQGGRGVTTWKRGEQIFPLDPIFLIVSMDFF